MPNNSIFNRVPVQIPNKSAFNMDHENVFTAKVGDCVPILTDFLLPNDTVHLRETCQVQLPPMATDFYGRVEARMEAFFVPFRILYGGWQKFMTHDGNIIPGFSPEPNAYKYLPSLIYPTVIFDGSSVFNIRSFGSGSLSDMLGLSYVPTVSTSIYENISLKNPLPFFAYHKIWDDWYRDSRIQRAVFSDDSSLSKFSVSRFPYESFKDSVVVGVKDGVIPTTDLPSSDYYVKFNDGHSIYDLRKRNYDRDYFTNATVEPQLGTGSSVAFRVDTSTGDGSFSIASLRAANSLQMWLEKNNIAGARYSDQIEYRFGIRPSDAVTDRAIYLGSQRLNVYTKSVYQQSPDSSPSTTRNPFNTVGTKYGSPLGVDSNGTLVDTFTATEHGILMVIFSIVPVSYYGSGTRRYWSYSQIGDFPDPLLSGVGDQPIYVSELYDGTYSRPEILTQATWGYTQRFAEAKFMNDEVHGLMKDGQSLEAFALKRSFAEYNVHIPHPSISSDFIEIKSNALDDVAAVSSSVSDFGSFNSVFFNYNKVSTLPAYSIPTLGDPSNVHTEMKPNGGTRL